MAHLPVLAANGVAVRLFFHGPDTLSQFIMGLGGFIRTWSRQTKDFGHTEAEKYTTLVFDNRGMGESGKPLLRYTTSEMARDLVELLDHVGWTEDRSVHVVGISMGGMIAQELVCLTLICLELHVRGDHFTDSSINHRACSSQSAFAASTSSPRRRASPAQNRSWRTCATASTS